MSPTTVTMYHTHNHLKIHQLLSYRKQSFNFYKDLIEWSEQYHQYTFLNHKPRSRTLYHGQGLDRGHNWITILNLAPFVMVDVKTKLSLIDLNMLDDQACTIYKLTSPWLHPNSLIWNKPPRAYMHWISSSVRSNSENHGGDDLRASNSSN